MRLKPLALALSLVLVVATGAVQSVTEEAVLREAAATGDAQAQRELALHLDQQAQHAEARELLETSLAAGDRAAGFLLAQHLLEVGGVGEAARAAKLAQRYQPEATPERARLLGLRMATRAIDPDLPLSDRQSLAKSALDLLRPAYVARDPDALWNVGYLGVLGLPRPMAIDGPLVSIELAAESGHGPAAAWLARYYLDGQLAPVDAARGVASLTVAAKAGHGLAMLELASRYGQGRGVERDTEISAFWSEQALAHRGKLEPLTAEVPLPKSMRSLAAGPLRQFAGPVFSAGPSQASASSAPAGSVELERAQATIASLTAERDQLRASLAALQLRYDALLSEHLASQRDAETLNAAGMEAYALGDYETALPSFRAAAETGHAPAQSNLAMLYINGQAVPQDVRQGIALLRRASDQGHLPATESLARLYHYGLGVHADPSRAITFYQRALGQGSAVAAEALAELDPRGQ